MKLNQYQKWNLEMHRNLIERYGEKYWERVPIKVFHNLFRCVAENHSGGKFSRDVNCTVAHWYLKQGQPVINIRCWECQQNNIY